LFKVYTANKTTSRIGSTVVLQPPCPNEDVICLIWMLHMVWRARECETEGPVNECAHTVDVKE